MAVIGGTNESGVWSVDVGQVSVVRYAAVM